MKIGDENLEAVPQFSFFRDMLTAGGGCKVAVVICCKCASSINSEEQINTG